MTIMRFGSILCGSYPFHQKCNASCGLQSSMPSLRKSFSTLVVCFLVLTNYVVHGVVSLKKTALTFCLHATSAGLFEVSFSNGGVLLGVLHLPFLILSKLGIAAHLVEVLLRDGWLFVAPISSHYGSLVMNLSLTPRFGTNSKSSFSLSYALCFGSESLKVMMRLMT